MLGSVVEKSKLIQKAEYRLHGNVQCLNKVSLPYSTNKQETLILSFNDAKVCLFQ